MPDETAAKPAAQRGGPPPGRGYHEKTWGGKPAYECDTCPFDTMNEKKMQAHVATLGHDATQ